MSQVITGTLVGGLLLSACTRGEMPRVDSTSSAAVIAGRATMDSLRRAKGIDTTTGMYQQASMMSAPIEAMPIKVERSDTLQVQVSADTCVMIVRAPAGPEWNGADWVFYASEGGTTIGPGPAFDAVASPDFKHYAYTALVRATAASPSTNAIVQVPTASDCPGDECPTPAAYVREGRRSIGWSADNKYLLLRYAYDSSRWVSYDARTVKRASIDGLVPAPVETKPVLLDANAGSSVTAGKFTYTSRGDSIFLNGPDRDGFPAVRFVGPGIPLFATRHGHYLIAVTHADGKRSGVLYINRVNSASARLDCTG